MRHRSTHGFRRLRGMTMLEIVFVTAIAAVPVIVVMTMISSSTTGTAHNRARIVAQMVLSNMVARYATQPPGRLDELFGDGGAGPEEIAQDPILNSNNAWSSQELAAYGIERDCFYYRISDKGFSGVLMMVVSYKDGKGNVRRLTQERMVGTYGYGDGGARALGGSLARTSFAQANTSWYGGQPARAESASTQALSAAARTVTAAPGTKERAQQVQKVLVEHLARVDRRDGKTEYAWAEAGPPPADGTVVSNVVSLVRKRPVPDGTYRYRHEALDYRLVDSRFGMPEERCDLVLFTLEDRKADSSYLMILERHGDVRTKVPSLELLDGQLMRSFGLYRLHRGDTAVDCWVLATAKRIFVAHPSVDRTGQVNHYVQELTIRTFETPWTLKEQKAASLQAGTAVDTLARRVEGWCQRLDIEGDGRFPGPDELCHPFGF